MVKKIGKTRLQYFCGEAPIVNPETGLIYIVDTGNSVCTEFNPDTREGREISIDGNFQCLAVRKSGGWLAVTEDEILICSDDLKTEKSLGNPLSGSENMLLGDGTVGPDGCFYVGAYNCDDLYSKDGCIFRVNKDLSIEKVLDNLALPNGMAFSSDNKKFYLTEMFGNCIWSFDFDRNSGAFSKRTKFADVPEQKGFPDGLIIDAEEGLWSAHWAGFCITRYNKDGAVDAVIDIPVPTPTCMAFGGKNMTELFVTTARKGLSEKELADHPDSGDLFIFETDVKGRTELLFEG